MEHMKGLQNIENDWNILQHKQSWTILFRPTFVLFLTAGKQNNNETLKLTMGCDQVKNYAANIKNIQSTESWIRL